MWKLWAACKRSGLALPFPWVIRRRRSSAKTSGAFCTRFLLFAVFTLALGNFAAFSKAEQDPSPSASRPVGVPSQPSIQAATAITQVDIRRTDQRAIVRVEGDGRLTVHTFHLGNPERFVLDFSGARLALAHTSIPVALKPIRRVRAGQFKPDVARVVIDLEQATPYIFRLEDKSVTITFALATEAASTEPTASQAETEHAVSPVPVRRTETSKPAAMSPAAFDASTMPCTELLKEPTSAFAGPVPPEARVEPSKNAVDDWMLTFNVQNQTLLSWADSTPPNGNRYIVSVRELLIPPKAQEAFEKGLELRAKNNPSASLAQFERAVAQFPSFYEAYLQMGLAYMELGQAGEAEKALRKSIDLSGDGYSDADFALSGLLADQDRLVEAERIARRRLAVAPASWQGQFQLGRVLLGMHQLQEAEQSAQKAHSIKPDFSAIYILLANIHLAQHHYAAQLKDVDEYLRLDPNGAFSAKAREVRDSVQRALSQLQSEPATTHGKP